MRATMVLLTLALSAAAAEPGPKPEVKPDSKVAESRTEIYTAGELLAKGETVLIATVGEATIDGTLLKDIHFIKGPPEDLLAGLPGAIRQKRAEELLNSEAAERAKLVKDPNAEIVRTPEHAAMPQFALVAAAPARLPAAGTQAVFVLWERETPTKALPIRYKASHPQNVYDIKLAAEVRLVLSRRKAEDNQRFLREWDASMARRLELRKDEDVLKARPAGNLESGLTLKALRPRASVRGDNSFDVTARFENSRGYDQAFYDGLQSGFGVRLRKREDPPEKAIVIRQSNKQLTGGVDNATLGIVDESDFETIGKEHSYSKELHFDAKDHPELKELNGEYVVNLFYVNTHSGKGLENLPAAPWTGTLISNEEKLVFKASTAAVPVAPKQP